MSYWERQLAVRRVIFHQPGNTVHQLFGSIDQTHFYELHRETITRETTITRNCGQVTLCNSVFTTRQFDEILPSRRNSRFELIISLILREQEEIRCSTRWQPSTRGIEFSGRSSPRFECQLLAFCSAAEKQGDIPVVRRTRIVRQELLTVAGRRNNLERSSSCNFVQAPRQLGGTTFVPSFAEAFLIEFVAEQKFREESSVVSLPPLLPHSDGFSWNTVEFPGIYWLDLVSRFSSTRNFVQPLGSRILISMIKLTLSDVKRNFYLLDNWTGNCM